MQRSPFDRVLGGVPVILLGSMLVAALHDVSQAWDSGYYHLPFAARLVGILPRDVYQFTAANQARFAGFPLLAERAQGVLWRVTGRAESANLVAFASVPLVALFLRRRFEVPWGVSVVALLAIPLVQTHATSAYVDLPANAAAAVLVLVAIEAWATREEPSARAIALAFLCGAIAANTKALLHPVVGVALLAIALRARRVLARPWGLAAIAAGFVVTFATPLVNLAAHGNPYWPVRLAIAGHPLPGVEDPYAQSPPWLAHAPRPARFVCSLLEMSIRPLTDERRWTVDQWMPDASGGNRMGGFFHAYVVAQLAILAWQIARDRGRRARAAGIGFALLTAVVSVLPQSHELRYYMVWMIALVGVNLALAWRRDSPARARTPLAIAALAALLVVLASTRGAYAYPSGSTFAELAARKVDPRALARIPEGARVCVQREPWTLLWAAPFHPPRRYVVQEAEEPEDCAGAPRADAAGDR